MRDETVEVTGNVVTSYNLVTSSEGESLFINGFLLCEAVLKNGTSDIRFFNKEEAANHNIMTEEKFEQAFSDFTKSGIIVSCPENHGISWEKPQQSISSATEKPKIEEKDSPVISNTEQKKDLLSELEKETVSSDPATTAKHQAGSIWSEAETLFLATKYAENMGNVGPLKKFKTGAALWKFIAHEMKQEIPGCSLTDKQCNNKMKLLKKINTSEKNHNRKSGNTRSPVALEDIMNQIKKKDDAFEPEALRGVGKVVFSKKKGMLVNSNAGNGPTDAPPREEILPEEEMPEEQLTEEQDKGSKETEAQPGALPAESLSTIKTIQVNGRRSTPLGTLTNFLLEQREKKKEDNFEREKRLEEFIQVKKESERNAQSRHEERMQLERERLEVFAKVTSRLFGNFPNNDLK